MAVVEVTKSNAHSLLAGDMGRFYADPLRYVMYAYSWGEGELQGFSGPRDWQAALLRQIGEEVREREFDGIHPVRPIQFATASGHGIGKSALTAWIVQWIMDTRPFAKGVVTANTSDQLRTKTWAEMGKWHRLSVTRDFWSYNDSRGNMNYYRIDCKDTWRCDALTCKEENSEAFAGLHAVNSTPFYVFDEASAIPEKIWEVSDGGLTDGEPMRFAWGNPTRNTGRFRECFRKQRHRWQTNQIDSRTVEGTNKEFLNEMVEDWGEDSDYCRVRVRGIFPRAASSQFISDELVSDAIAREALSDLTSPVLIGVDVARFGDCMSVIYPRIGRDAQTSPPRKFRGISTVQLNREVIQVIKEFQAIGRQVDGVFVEGAGVGGPVVDMLRASGIHVFEVNPGATARNQEGYRNVRAEMWGELRDWLAGGSIPNDQQLRDDLTSIGYGFTDKQQLALEKKEHMAARNLPSPDVGDALALTFAIPIMSDAQRRQAGHFMHEQNPQSHTNDGWHPFGTQRTR